MLRALLCRFLSLWLVLGYQCSWAAVPRKTKLRLETSVVKTASPFPVFSGDRVTFHIVLTHATTSQAKAVDALVQLQIPIYLKVWSYDKENGVPWSSVDTSEKWTMKFKFDDIMVSKLVNLSLVVDVDPYYIANAAANHNVAILADLWYYGEDGPCSRPPSMYNAMHEFERLSLKFESTTACEKRIKLLIKQYSASSASTLGPAYKASFSHTGVWQTADYLAKEKNQYLQLDLSRLMRITKIATRGQTTPSVAFVRTYQVYHSKDIVKWFSVRENNDIKVFQANTDGQNVVFNPMPSPTLARYLRIVAKSWKRRQAMDVEVFGCQVHPNENLVDYCPIFDFENGVSDWTSTGTAFKNQPTIGDNYKVRKEKSGNIQGNSWIATYEDRMRSYIPAGGKQGDAPVGTLTSPSFLVVTSKFHFLIGGTMNNTDARVELVIDGKSVRQTSGNSNTMTESTWFVKQFRGKEAVLRLVDDTDKGHLNFDAFRVDCFLDADAHGISLPSRAVMLNSRTHSFYVCDSSHLRSEDSALCRVMSGLSDRWIDIPDILGLLGVDKSTHQLYAISKDRYVITSINPAGGDWRYVKKSDWDEAKSKATMIRVEAIPWITLRDGVNEQIFKTLADSNGDQWKATSLGISYQPAGQSWVKIAAWRCHAFEIIDDPCFSEPCENHANCTAVSRDKYNCSCVPGYTGVNCETDIDECANVYCENGGTCVQGINKYFCRCPFGVSGFHCENLLPACRTSPCLNGATCVDETPPDFRCDCTSNYKGTLCEIEKEPCLDNPCNGNVCIPTEGGGYRCVCKYGFTGTNCRNGVETNFNILQSQTVTDVNSYLVIKAQIPDHGKSHNENWCRDYERLCAKKEWEPTGFGRSYNHIEGYASCQEKYHSVMDRANVLGAKPNEKVAALAQQAGFTDATPNNSFAFNACDGTKCSDILPDSGCHEGLSCISKSVPNLEVYTVCIHPNSQFRTIKKVWAVINGVRQLTVQVRTPSRYSQLTTWCDDYEALCDRYGLRATGDGENTGCVEKYRAIFNANNDNGQVRNALGTSSGFYFRDCSYCNRNSYSTSQALNSFKYYYNHFGVACMQPNGIGFKVLDDKKLTNYSGKDHMVIKVQVPSNGKSNDTNWCEDYKQLCDSYRMVPLGCGDCVTQYRSSSTTCPISGNEVEQMVRYAGFSSASSSNTFLYKSCEACSRLVTKGKCRAEDLFCFDEGNPYRVFYTACVKDDKKYLPKQRALRMRDFKFIVYQSLPYKVLRLLNLPEDGKPMLSNWCEEYQTLCTSVGGRPVGCGPSHTSNPDVATCGSVYGAAMENDGLRCGNDNGIAVDMARTAGYSSSNTHNTFKFNNCSSASCAQQLTYSCSSWRSTCTCHPAFSCLKTEMSKYSREAFAICSMKNSAFKVLETKDSTYGGHDVLVVKAQIPSDGSSLTGDWCEEYRTLCYGYGYRPTGCGVDHADDINYASCRYVYQSVMPKDNVYGCPAVNKISLIANAAGFAGVTAGNSFGFSDCNATCVSTLTSGGPFIDLSVADGIVYTICETSDSNFKVMSAVQSVYKGGEYTYVQALVPQDLISKHDTWCTDYLRMCESFGLKPVVRSETHEAYETCRKAYGAINTKLNEATASSELETFGNHFLRHSRMRNTQNAFVFGQWCDKYCVKDMNNGNYRYALEYLRTTYMYEHDYNVFTVCASSDSNFHVISTKTIAHKGQDYLVIMAKLPEHRMSKYENWCRDYERLCRSFRRRPTGCGLSYQWSSKHRACVDKYQSAMAMNDPVGCNSSESVATIANLAGYKFADPNNSFAFHQCSSECPQTLSRSCSDALPCLNDRSDIVYTLCTDSSSAFEVERVLHTNEGNTPLLFVIATLNGAVKAKSGDWCRDYERLCQSYAARPVGCHSSQDNNHLAKCSTNYNAVPLQSDIQRCGSDGESDINRLRVLVPNLPDGAHFKCHKCKADDCKKTLSSSCNGALNCLKESDWVYTTCSRASHNFDIIETKTTSHGELTDILAIKALVPIDGRSLYDSWCEDYTKLCSTYDMVPLACPLRPDYTAESAYRACNKEYNGYMMRNYALQGNATLSCPLNNLISDIAKQAKLTKVSPSNTLGLNTCLSCSKTLQVVNGSASYLSMSCPPGGTCKPWNATSALDRNVFLLCVKPPRVNSTFHIDEVRYVQQRGRRYASVRVSMPYGEESLHDDWCTDYQKICESISMRPIATGRSFERLFGRRKCREKYNAVMPSEYDNSNDRFIADIARAAGYNYNEYEVFSLNDCNLCSRNIFVSRGVDWIYSTGSTYYTACTYSDSSFEELQTRKVTVDGKSFLVVKAQLPADMISSHETWCKDYQMMCESYGKRPLTCAENADLQTSYNALLLTHNCDSSIPKQAGFADATEENTLVFKSYNRAKCSRRLRNADGPFGRLNSSVPHRLVYAICLNSHTAFEVLAKKLHKVSDRTYLFLQVAMPENGKANYNTWCHEYKELCSEYGQIPVSCSEYYCRIYYGAPRKKEHVCPLDNMVSLAEGAGMSRVTKETSFLYSFVCTWSNCKKVVETRNCTARGKQIPLCYDRDVNNGEFTTVCTTPTEQTGFSTLDVKYVNYVGRPYTVIRTRKNYRDSRQNNWCNDYKHLCRSFTQRPLACPTRYNTDPDLHLCQRSYEGVSMETDSQECPMNKFVAELAQYAGFSRATPRNSFALRNCNSKFCTNRLPTSECSEALYCVNMLGDQEDLYTACTGSDSAFNVRGYKLDVNYKSVNYGVIKVTVSEGQKSAHRDWCKDYQRLCESWHMEAVQCASGLELASDICSIKYGAHQKLSSCAADAKAIAVKASLGHVADKTALVMDGCKYCPNIVTKTCSSSLNCLRSSTLFVVCSMRKQVGVFKPVQTRFVNYGNTAYLLIQSQLIGYQSKSFMNNYNDLCENIYGYQAILCGRNAVSGSSEYRSCIDDYANALSHQGNDFYCPPAKTVAFIAQRFGFYQATHDNSFAFHRCSRYHYYNRYSGYYSLSSTSCYERLWCLLRDQYHNLQHTMCAVPKPSPSLGFHVLDKKELIFLEIKYVAFKLSIGTSGVSATDNWCLDYRELCLKHNMVPTGCGTSKKKEAGYLECSSKYRSFMSHRNAVGCGKNSAPSSLARRAGFPDATQENTFVFNDCSKCAKNLQPTSCDPALTCLYSEVFNKYAYTLCVERKSGFEYIAKKKTIYAGVEYLVVRSALPVDDRPLYENWCVDYQKLCHSVGAFPVACSLGSGVQDSRRFAEKYGAITVESIPCPPIAKVLAIVKKAGYSKAIAGNSFVFTGDFSDKCSKYLPTVHCIPGLDCLNKQSREVYAVCINPTNFAVSDVRTSRLSGNTFTVVEARLPTSGLSKTSSWCEDYATLCRSMKQQPIVCPGYVGDKLYEKCRDNYDGYLLFDKYKCNKGGRQIYEIAHRAGFAKGNFANTIGFASCASCSRELHAGPECDSLNSLNCVNNQTAGRLVYALCLRESENSGFQVIETKETITPEVEYKVVKAIVSPFGISKYDTWCKDYERMCSGFEMRPVRCSSSDGNACPLMHKALVSSQEQFYCDNNAGLLQFVKSAGYSEANENNTFIFGACSTAEQCRMTLLNNSCDGSMNCLKKQPASRLVFTLCARGRHTSFRYLDSAEHTHNGVNYFVIKASKFSDLSKSINWCYDYRDMCVSFGKQPVVWGSLGEHFNNDRNQCFGAYNATSTMVWNGDYHAILKEMSMPYSNCRVVYTYCKSCIKTFEHCPFRACNCDLFYLFCL